jgi:hypothetical protein
MSFTGILYKLTNIVEIEEHILVNPKLHVKVTRISEDSVSFYLGTKIRRKEG